MHNIHVYINFHTLQIRNVKIPKEVSIPSYCGEKEINLFCVSSVVVLTPLTPLTLTDILFSCQQGLFFFSPPQQAQNDTTRISNTLCESLLKVNKSSSNIA